MHQHGAIPPMRIGCGVRSTVTGHSGIDIDRWRYAAHSYRTAKFAPQAQRLH
jgi:hypothetical protein